MSMWPYSTKSVLQSFQSITGLLCETSSVSHGYDKSLRLNI